jgi:hypothetical protein
MKTQSAIRLVLQPHNAVIGVWIPSVGLLAYAQAGFCPVNVGGWNDKNLLTVFAGRAIGQSHRWRGCHTE